MPDDHVIVGTIGKPHGLKGDVFVFPETDNPDRFTSGSVVYVAGDRVTITSSRTVESRLIVRFSHLSDRSAAEQARGTIITIPEVERRVLEPDEWWPDDLVGLRVLDHTGQEQGTVAAVIEGVAQDRLMVSTADGDVEIPFVTAIVPVVEVERGFIQLSEIEGLLTGDRGAAEDHRPH